MTVRIFDCSLLEYSCPDFIPVYSLHYIFLFFQVHAPGCPVIIVGTHLDQVSCKNTICLKKLVDKLYGDSSTYPIIAAVTFLSSASQKLTRRNDVNELRKEIYYVATHLFPVRNTGNDLFQYVV